MPRLARLGVVLALLGAVVYFGVRGLVWQGEVVRLLAGEAQVRLYFAAQQADRLVPEARRVPAPEATPRGALQALARGPANPQLSPTIPQGAWLRWVRVERDGLAVVNYSQALRDRHWGGSAGELMTVYSIVSTLTEFPGVERVLILIEGERVDTLVGHLDLSQPLARDDGLIHPPTPSPEA